MIIRNNRPLRLSPLAILRRGHYRYFFRFWFQSYLLDKSIAGRSLSSTMFNPNSAHYPVQSISYPYLEMLPAALDLTTDDCFVDIGCGYGRLLGYLSLHTNCGKLIGIELNSDAVKVSRTVEGRLNNVTILEGDATCLVPEEATVLFLFNPFDASVLTKFLEQVEASCMRGTRIDYLYPEHENVFVGRARWRKCEETVLKPEYLGPLRLVRFELI